MEPWKVLDGVTAHSPCEEVHWHERPMDEGRTRAPAGWRLLHVPLSGSTTSLSQSFCYYWSFFTPSLHASMLLWKHFISLVICCAKAMSRSSFGSQPTSGMCWQCPCPFLPSCWLWRQPGTSSQAAPSSSDACCLLMAVSTGLHRD